MILQVTVLALSPRWPGGEGKVRGADKGESGAAHLTLPSVGDGPLPLPPEGRRAASASVERIFGLEPRS